MVYSKYKQSQHTHKHINMHKHNTYEHNSTRTQPEPQEHQFHNSNTSHTSHFTSPNIDYHITSPPTHLGFSNSIFSLHKHHNSTTQHNQHKYNTSLTLTLLDQAWITPQSLLLLPSSDSHEFQPKTHKKRGLRRERKREDKERKKET